jgi:hypothetical protein
MALGREKWRWRVSFRFARAGMEGDEPAVVLAVPEAEVAGMLRDLNLKRDFLEFVAARSWFWRVRT